MKNYKAIATLTDGVKYWDVTIYSHYSTINEAIEDTRRFASHGYNIIKIEILEVSA